MKPIASQGQFSSRFILIEATMATTSLSEVVDAQGLTLVGFEMPANSTATSLKIQELPRFASSTPIVLKDQSGADIAITVASGASIARFSPLIFPTVGQIRVNVAAGTVPAGSVIGLLFIKPQGER